MTTKILTLTGKVVHWSTYRPLMLKALADTVLQDHMKAFLITARDWWDTCLARGKLDEVGLIDTSKPVLCLNNEQMDKSFPAPEEEITPEDGDEYIQVSIMIPCDNTFA